MSKLHIKFCGINKKPDVIALAALPIDFMGFIFHSSPRQISVECAKECVEHLLVTNINPVGVFVNHTASEIIDICDYTHIQIVQLHGDIARNAQIHLPSHLARIFVIDLSTDGKVITDLSQTKFLNPSRDYLLFDLKKGELNNQQHFSSLKSILNRINPSMPYFIAGGINSHNVQKYIDDFSPFGIDLASSLEDEHKHKNISLAKQFISNIQESGHAI